MLFEVRRPYVWPRVGDLIRSLVGGSSCPGFYLDRLQVVRGRNAEEAGVSGRNGPFQLRIPARNAARVLSRDFGGLEVCTCLLLHHEACKANE